MYLWLALDVESHLARLTEKRKQVDRDLGFCNPCTTLPAHISLKISFYVRTAETEAVLATVRDLFSRQKPFSVSVLGMEREGNVLWLRIAPCEELTALHGELCRLLEQNHEIHPHPYDLDYKFHVSLAMSDNAEILSRMEKALRTESLPVTLPVDTFLVGTSDTGLPGEYTVRERIAMVP